VFICEHSWNPTGTSEFNCDNIVEDRPPNIWENFKKLINNESSVFTNVSINPVFEILSDDSWASRSSFIVHICPPPPLNQTTPLPHTPLVHDTLPIHSDKFGMDFARVKLFMSKN
jgi:hypothetical protein